MKIYQNFKIKEKIFVTLPSKMTFWNLIDIFLNFKI